MSPYVGQAVKIVQGVPWRAGQSGTVIAPVTGSGFWLVELGPTDRVHCMASELEPV